MKTKSTIKLFATAILATAAIGAADVVNTAQNVFASEVTQVPNKNNVGTRTTFETDPVFKNFEEGEKYLDNYVKPTIENSRYGYYTASVVPDGLGGNYLVEGFIDSHSEDADVIKGNKETAQKIVDNAGKDLSQTTPTTPTTPTTDDKPVEIPATPVEPSTPAVTPSETPAVPASPAVPSAPTVTPTETPNVPAAPSVTPSETPAAPAASSVTPTEIPSAPSVNQEAPTAPTAPTKPVEDNSKPTLLQNSDAKPAQSIVALAGGKKEDAKPSKSEDPKQSNAAKNDESKTESSKKSDSSEPVKKGEDKLKELPNTGEGSSNLGIVGLMILSVLAGFFGFKKRNG